MMHSDIMDGVQNMVAQQHSMCSGYTSVHQQQQNNNIRLRAFKIWSSAKRKTIEMNYPSMCDAGISKILEVGWKLLTVKERRPFIGEANRLVLQHMSEQIADYQYTYGHKPLPTVKLTDPDINCGLSFFNSALNKAFMNNPTVESDDAENRSNIFDHSIAHHKMHSPYCHSTIDTSDSQSHNNQQLTSMFDNAESTDNCQDYKVSQHSKKSEVLTYVNKLSDSVHGKPSRPPIGEYSNSYSSVPHQKGMSPPNRKHHMIPPASITTTLAHNFFTYNSCKPEMLNAEMHPYEMSMHFSASPCRYQNSSPITSESPIQDTIPVKTINNQADLESLSCSSLDVQSTSQFMECPCIECMQKKPIIINS